MNNSHDDFRIDTLFPQVSGYVKIFPGVPHGWAVRYKDEDETAVKLANEAHQDMLDWFTKYMQ